MSNSPLVNYTKLSPHCNKPRKAKIDTITIHHMAGNITVETCGQVFQTRQASSNYGVDGKGRIGMYVEEANRSWASSSPENDHRAVTIEVANSGGAPDWPVNDKAYAALIELVADICKRNGIEKLVWSDFKSDRVNHKNGCNMTVHQDFAATNCPGPYLLKKMPQIAADVNKKLTPTVSPAPPAETLYGYHVKVTATHLPIRSGPSTAFASKNYIKPGVYTIVEEQKSPDGSTWGRLKSGAGWIILDGVMKI